MINISEINIGEISANKSNFSDNNILLDEFDIKNPVKV